MLRDGRSGGDRRVQGQTLLLIGGMTGEGITGGGWNGGEMTLFPYRCGVKVSTVFREPGGCWLRLLRFPRSLCRSFATLSKGPFSCLLERTTNVPILNKRGTTDEKRDKISLRRFLVNLFP